MEGEILAARSLSSLDDAVWVFVAGQSDLQLSPCPSSQSAALALTAGAGGDFLQEYLLTERALITHPAPSVFPLQSVLAPSRSLGSDCWLTVYQVLDISQLLFLAQTLLTFLTGRGRLAMRGQRAGGPGGVERGGGGGGGRGGHLVTQL